MWATRAVNVSFGGIAVRVSYNIISYSASTTTAHVHEIMK